MSEAFAKYTPEEAPKSPSYDLCSITHALETDYAANGQKSFSVKVKPFFVPKIEQLSNSDCKELSTMYKCPASSCPESKFRPC